MTSRKSFLSTLLGTLCAMVLPWRDSPAKQVGHWVMAFDPAFTNGDHTFLVTQCFPPTSAKNWRPYIIRVEKLSLLILFLLLPSCSLCRYTFPRPDHPPPLPASEVSMKQPTLYP